MHNTRVPTIKLAFNPHLSTPATSAWEKGLSVVPSSLGLTTMAFRPANLPERSRTTFPAFIIFPMLLSETIHMVVGFEDIKGIASMCYSNTAHSKRFSRLAGLLPLLGLDLAKVELEFLALKMEKIYQVYSKFRNSSRPLILLIRFSVQILKANNVCPMLRRALWENMKILQSSKLARLQVFLFVLPCLS